MKAQMFWEEQMHAANHPDDTEQYPHHPRPPYPTNTKHMNQTVASGLKKKPSTFSASASIGSSYSWLMSSEKMRNTTIYCL